jgi:CheY-like chemotaxis protein
VAHILVVDDEPLIRLLLTTMLRQLQHDVTEACNGYDALTQVKRNPYFDLVITDIQMPQLDGIELFTILQREYPALPVIVLSAHPEFLEEALQYGATNLLKKPFSWRQLNETVANTLNPNVQSDGYIHSYR